MEADPRPSVLYLRRGREAGSALLIVLCFGALLTAAAGVALQRTLQKYHTVSHAVSWREALAAAEGGVAVAQMTLKDAAVRTPDAWAGWSNTDPMVFPKTRTITFPATQGDRVIGVTAEIEISRPMGVNTLNPPNSGKPYYRVRSAGTADVAGPARLGENRENLLLRKVALRTDWRTGQNVTRPRITRVVEAVLKPEGPFGGAITVRQQIEIKKGKKMVVDSFDPMIKDYTPGTANSNGHIATTMLGLDKKGTKLKTVIRLEEVQVKGSALKGAGLVEVKSNASIAGEIIDGFSKTLNPVASPATDPSYFPIETMPDQLSPAKSETVLVAGPPGLPRRYSMSKLHIHKEDILTIENYYNPTKGSGKDPTKVQVKDKQKKPGPLVDLDGLPLPQSYIEIYVAGDIKVHDAAQIFVEPGVHLTIYAGRNIKLEGKDGKPSIVNEANRAENVQIYGVLPDKKKKKRKMKVKGALVAAIYAPDHDIELKSDKKSGGYKSDFFGAVVGRRFKMQGEMNFHYDESLGNVGPTTGYSIASWVEDWTLPKFKQ